MLTTDTEDLIETKCASKKPEFLETDRHTVLLQQKASLDMVTAAGL